MSGLALVLAGGICALESAPDGVRARGCGGDAEPWTIEAPPAAAVVNGTRRGVFRGHAVDVALDDGESLWLGVSELRDGRVEPLGLVRHDRGSGVVHAFRGTDAGPCGFHVHDLMLRDGTLWVATDQGVSRLRLSREDWDEWTHYAPAGDSGRLEETACAAVLSGIAESAAATGGADLARWLAEFRPKFWRRYRAQKARGMRPASRVREEGR